MSYTGWFDISQSDQMLEALCSVPFSREQVAVAVSHSQLGGGHIGLAFFTAGRIPSVLHLAWHRDLRIEGVPDELGACWAACVLPIPPKAAKQVVAYVRTVAARKAQIDYGIDFIGAMGSFTPQGAYRPPRGSTGLTCASFVLEVLRGASVVLVREETWMNLPANDQWAEEVCEMLMRTGASPDHIVAVKSSANGLRLRPFEVAGAGTLPPNQLPAGFNDVQVPSQVVAANLDQLCPRA